MKDGTVVSISDTYGFIRDEAGTSFYFNDKNLQAGSKLSGIAIGDKVSFSPKAGPKGMIANAVTKIRTFSALQLGEKLIFSRDEAPFRSHERPVEASFTHLQAGWFRSPDSARQALKEAIKATGANAAVNLGMHISTWSHGHYRYTMHSAFADVGVYFVPQQTVSECEADQITRSSELQAHEIKERLGQKQAELAQLRERNTPNNNLLYILVSVILAIVICGFIFL